VTRLVLLVALLGCHNEAEELAHVLEPSVYCQRLVTDIAGRDVAVCTLRSGEQWYCTENPPTCRVLGDVVRR